MINKRFIVIVTALLFIVAIDFFSGISHAATAADANSQVISKMFGEITIMSNYVEKGLTQSNKNPSLGANLGYGFGAQGKIGFAAYSVTYPSENVSVSMRGYGEYKFIFTPNADLRIRNDLVRYFSDANRNDIIVNLDQNFFTYHLLFQYEDNFEGSKTKRNWFGVHKDWPLGATYHFDVTGGYSMLDEPGLKNYFDTKVGIGYASPTFSAGVFDTYTSEASQFHGQGKMFLLLEIVAKF